MVLKKSKKEIACSSFVPQAVLPSRVSLLLSLKYFEFPSSESMMDKKKSEDNNISAPSSIFTTLFGGIPNESTVASSLFSDSNPFKRQHRESQSAENESIFNPMNSDSLDSNNSELKKIKKTRQEKPNPDLPDAEGAATKTLSLSNKSTKLISPRSILGFEPNGTMENEIKKEHSSNVGSESYLNRQKQNSNFSVEGKKRSENKKTKKRKRDDVEKDYVEKKYGVIAKEEEGKKVVVGEKRKKADNETEDMLVHRKEEGFDDEGKLLRTIFVGNLPLKVKKKTLIKEFIKFGEIDSVRIRSVPIIDTKIPRKGAILQKQINENADSVHAYIVFKSEQSTEAALAFNMAVIGGNHIRLDRACPPRKKLKGEDTPLYDIKKTVFVGNLPFDVKDEEIYQLFCGLNDLESSVEAVRVIRHPHMRVGKGIAYVLFKTREAANLVIKRRNLKLRDRELRLSHAQQNCTPSKRKDVAPAVNSPPKKFVLDSRTLGSGNRSNSKVAMSYQGLQASKSCTQKKVHSGSSGVVKMKKSRTQKGERPKVQLEKRPAVALRKARAKAPKDVWVSRQAGMKRKMESQTPEISQRKKAKVNER